MDESEGPGTAAEKPLGLTRRRILTAAVAGGIVFLTSKTRALGTLRAGVLQFGTVHWLLDVIKHHKLDERHGFALDIRLLASNSAADVALLGQQADVIVADWLWVMRQRSLGGDYFFMPYSAAVGSVIVPPGSNIQNVADLKGKRIGVAGGPLDKSWLLLRAYGLKQGVGDLASAAQPTFAAPPLLNEQIAAGRLDALLNYWPFSARLEALGYKRIATVAEMMRSLDIKSPLPLVGFVFPAQLANTEAQTLSGFATAVQNAQHLLLTNDAEWERVRPLMKAGSDAEFRTLRDRYREGLVYSWGERDREAARQLFEVLATIGGEELTGKGVQFDPRAFWDGLVF